MIWIPEKREYVYCGKVLNLRLDTIKTKDERTVTWEIVEFKNAVTVVPLIDGNRVLMIKQYRHAIGEELIEFPAGTFKEDETPEEAALRELKEETGYEAGEMKKVMEFYTVPGLGTELMHLFVAKNLKKGEKKLDQDEEIENLVLTLDEAFDLLYKGIIKDGKTIIGLFYLKLYGDSV